MAVAVTIEQARRALAGLDTGSRALLHLSIGRGLPDHVIADLLHVEPSDVHHRVDDVFDRIAGQLSLDGREQRDELRATLPDLPHDVWQEEGAADGAPHP